MKIFSRIVSFFLIFTLLLPCPAMRAEAKGMLNVSARSACLIEAESGRVLYSKNAEARMPMASTTKIMTALVAIEHGPTLDTVVKIPRSAVGVEGSSIYLAEGELITFEVLLYALLLSSANDAAVAISYAVCGSLEGFVALMNQKAAALGLSNTHFENPHGLDGEGHYTSASDLASLLAYATKNDTFLKVSGTEKLVVPKGDDGTRVLINHNRLLRTYDGVISGKTGFTKRSGRCLATCAERDGLRLIAVTLNAPNDWNDHTALFDFGFENYQKLDLESVNLSLPVISGQKSEVALCSEATSLLIHRSHGEFTLKIEAPRLLFAPIDKGDRVGRVLYYCDGKLIATAPLYVCEDVEAIKYRFNLFEWLIDLFKGFFD